MEEQKQDKKEEKKQEKSREQKAREEKMHEMYEGVVRILAQDIPGNKKVDAGLTRIKGISWTFSNAICKKLNISRNKKMNELSEEEIKKISDFIVKPELPEFLLNRKKDIESGQSRHLHGTELDLQKEFDIKRLKKIKCYKGIRHSAGQPVRGQRTRSHFRVNRKKTGAVGVRREVKPKAATGGKEKNGGH